MSVQPLSRVLEATGYFADGQPAPGVRLGHNARSMRRGRMFAPDALWRGSSALTVYFKFEVVRPADDLVAVWRREIWNEGFAPLLWVISPDHIDLYNGFGRPQQTNDATKNRLRTFRNLDAAMNDLDALAVRFELETGYFWTQVPSIDRKTGVDQQLLLDIALLESDLVAANLDRAEAQGLIGRSIFTQYLIDRGIVSPHRLQAICGHSGLPPILREREAAKPLFKWLSDTFNGDMFPLSSVETTPRAAHLGCVADFLEAVDKDGQTNLFPYQFDVIPVELISSIYEQFVHSAESQSQSGIRGSEASAMGVYYTRLPVVSLVLDEVMFGLRGTETVLDLTCGSGVFLVEALRRLVDIQSNGSPPTRGLVRSILYEQVFGVDISEAAIRVAAFSLYLAALELDPNPQPPQALKFKPLINRTLVVGDARNIETTISGKEVMATRAGLKKFDIIVGNPPWTFKGKAGTAARRKSAPNQVAPQPRGEGLDFVLRAVEFSHDRTRFGMILSAMTFFSGSKTGAAASRHVVNLLSPVTLVNLANLSSWLFPTAKMPAVALFARQRPQRIDQMTVVQIPWSLTGSRSHTFEIAPSDIIKLSLSDWEKQPIRLKTAAVGHRRDLMLLDTIMTSNEPICQRLSQFGAELHVGLIRGNANNRTRDARALRGLDVLEVDDLRPFSVPQELGKFDQATAQWPRSPDIYRAPLLLVKEFLTEGPRPVVAVADRDLVFTNAYFGASLPKAQGQVAHLLAGILSSALAAWFFIMTAAEFGIWKRRLLCHDVGLLPTPDLQSAVQSDAGQRILQLEKGFRENPAQLPSWTALDDAVFDLYDLDATDRVVARDGLSRGSWEWQPGLEASIRAANIEHDMKAYARTFLMTIDGWLSARNRRRMCAEIFDLPARDPLRVVRFVIEQKRGPSRIEVVTPNGDLRNLLSSIGKRINVRLTDSLIGERELRAYGANEIIIIKPAAMRHWMGVSALEDADAVISESIAGPIT